MPPNGSSPTTRPGAPVPLPRLFSIFRVVSKYKYIDETDSVIDSFFELAGYPNFLKPLAVFYFKRKATKGLKASFGLFSDAEFDMLLRKDLGALKGILGEKQFFLGDKISNVSSLSLSGISSNV